jgi:phage shock protein PspC (stress-responsive transcriptional regulator)
VEADEPEPDLRVVRSEDRVLLGVAGGIADAIGVAAVWVRLVFVATAFLHGLGVLAYAAAWLLMPAGPGAPARPRPVRLLGLLVAGVAAVVLVAPFGVPRGEIPVALALLGIGAAVWDHRGARPRRRPPAVRPARPSSPPAVPASEAVPAAARVQDRRAAAAARRNDRQAARRAAKAARPRSVVPRLALAGALVACAVGIAVGASVSVTAGVAAAVLGAGMVVASFVRRGRWLLVPGLVAVMVAVGAWAVEPLQVPSVTSGELGWVQPTGDGPFRFRSGVGTADIDISALDPGPNGVDVELRAATGSVNVYARDDQRVIVDLAVGAGSIAVDGGPDRAGLRRSVNADLGGSGASPPIRVTVAVGAGSVRVWRIWQPAPEPMSEEPSPTTLVPPSTVPAAAIPAPVPRSRCPPRWCRRRRSRRSPRRCPDEA